MSHPAEFKRGVLKKFSSLRGSLIESEGFENLVTVITILRVIFISPHLKMCVVEEDNRLNHENIFIHVPTTFCIVLENLNTNIAGVNRQISVPLELRFSRWTQWK